VFVPLACPAMQFRHHLGLRPLQTAPQQVGKQMVIPIPATVVAQGYSEQIDPFEPLEHLLTVRLPGEGIAQRPTQAVENGGLQQEALDVGWLTAKDLFDKVIHQVAIAAGKGLDESGHIVAMLKGLEGERCQLQSCHPTFGAGLKGLNLLRY